MTDAKETSNIESENGFFSTNLIKSRVVIISGEINQELTKDVLSQLLVLDELSKKPIYIYLNSQGGHVEAADSIHDTIKFIDSEVIIIGTGWVASAGITILLAAEKNNRLCLPNTRFMIHQPLGGVRGPASDMEIEARQILLMLDRINKLISKATNQPYERVKKDTDRNYWMSASEAIDYGIVGKIINTKNDLS
jgi:ATP-dependent Clp protease protease subunit